MEINQHRLIIVSNRLPFEIESVEGELSSRPGSGGLVTALAPVLKNRGGLWVGWPGGLGIDTEKLKPLVAQAAKKAGFTFIPVFLSKELIDAYYHGFSNEIIWPLFHDLQTRCHFVPHYWQGYQEANEAFAEVLVKKVGKEDFVWVHDYQLMLVGQGLRKRGLTAKVGFFLHIPFPPLDIFMKLPWRFEVLKALLEYDLIGFQTPRDYRNFIHCIRQLKPARLQNLKSMHLCHYEQREIRIGAFPISIDFKEFADHAGSKTLAEAATLLRKKWPDQKLCFSIDRLDYTKGIPDRLEAIRLFLKKYPEFHKRICFVQVIIPSRVDIPDYQLLKQEIDRLVGEINSHYTQENWVPIHHIFHPLTRAELLAYYRTSDIALITPLKDGMNLVAKEYAASQIDKQGVLILSEFAGASVQLRHGALLIHPYDIENMTEAIHTALAMSGQERRRRMSLLQRLIKRQDIFWWVKVYMMAAFARTLDDFPELGENDQSQSNLVPEENLAL